MHLIHYSFTLTIPEFLKVDLSSGCLRCLSTRFKRKAYGKLIHDDQKAFIDYLLHAAIWENTSLEYYFEETPSSLSKHLHVHGIVSFNDIENFEKWKVNLFKILGIKTERQQLQMLNYSEVNSDFWKAYMLKQQPGFPASLLLPKEEDDRYSLYPFGKRKTI